MKFPKGYLKSLTTKEQFEEAFLQAMLNNLSLSSAMAARKVAFKKGFIIGNWSYEM